MKNLTKNIVALASTIAFSGVALADQVALDRTQIQNEIAVSLNSAVIEINQPVVTNIAKVQLDRMSFMQNVEQFLVLVNSDMENDNDQTKAAKVEVIAE